LVIVIFTLFDIWLFLPDVASLLDIRRRPRAGNPRRA